MFVKLVKLGRLELRSPDEPIYMVSATGEMEKITGVTDVIMHFEGINGVDMTFEINVMVHPNLSQDFLLGRDFSGSAAKAFETNSRLFLTNNPDVHMGDVQTTIKDKTLCEVPLINSGTSPMYVANTESLVIPPFSTVPVKCYLQKSAQGSYQLPLRTSGVTAYEVLHATFPRLTALPMLYTFDKMDNIMVPLRNDSNDYITLDENTTVAQIELWKNVNQFDISHITIREYKPKVSASMTVSQTCPKFILEDDTMNDEEKEEAFMHYVRYGYHHPSMTKEVEDKSGWAEMALQPEEEVPDELFETQFDIAHLPTKEREAAIKVFERNKKAFSKHPFDLGKARDITMKIPIITDQPHIQKYIPIPHKIRPQVREILDQYVDRGIIRECDEPSPFCSNILVVHKKDGKSIRLLLDGRLLNNYTQRLPTNLVTQMELLAHLVGKKWVTTIDLSDAFYQIELDPASQPLTAFYSEAHGKRYCFMRCPQGLRNSPLHLKLVMDKLFSHMANDVIHYADDIMVATDGTLHDHLKKLSDVFQKLQEGNIKIRPQKVNVARDTVDFLGIVWKKNQISIPEARMLAFKNLPTPKTPKTLKSVICALSYYRKFIPNFAELSHELMQLTTLHPKQFVWTDQHENNFRKLINMICKNAVLYLPDPEKPYYVQTDASDFCGAGRVFQKDADGNELPLACVSRTFTKTERAYSTVKKEVLALLYTLRTMDFFLRFANKIIILVDAACILYLRMCREAAGILLRFSLELSKYDAEVHHVKGVDNEVSDVLSRQHPELERLKQEVKNTKPMSERQTIDILKRLSIPKHYIFTAEEVADMLDAPSLPNPDTKKAKNSVAKIGKRDIKNVPKMLNKRNIKMPAEVYSAPGAKLPQGMKPNWMPHLKNKRTKAKNLRQGPTKAVNITTLQCNALTMRGYEHQRLSYQDFSSISTAILSGILTVKDFQNAQRADDFCNQVIERIHKLRRYAVIKGLLFYRTKYICKLVLPNSLLDVIINAKHFSVFGLHFSKSRIMRDITSRYHVQGTSLREKLQMLKENCIICQFNASGLKDHELRRTDFIYAPRVTWAIDIIPNLPETVEGNKRALLAVDLFTGYIQVCPLKSRTAASLIKAIDTTIVRPFSVPKFIRSDNEPGLHTSNEFYEYLHPLGVKFFPTSVGSPWANGHAERSIRTIKEGIRKFLMQEKITENWDKYINLFTQAHNQSTSIYGYSPEELMFGYRKPNANDLIQFWPNARSHDEYVEKIFDEIEKKREISQQRSEENKERNRNYKNRDRIKKDFKVGEIVACRQLQVSTGPNSSMKPKLTGPYAIIAINDDQCSCMIEDLRSGSQSKEHFTNLVLINYHPAFNRVHSNFDDDIADMIEQLRDNKLKIKASTRRLLKLPSDHDEVDEPDDIPEAPDINAAGPADKEEVTLRDSQNLHHDDFGALTDREDDDNVQPQTGEWQKWFDEQIALMSSEEEEDEEDDSNYDPFDIIRDDDADAEDEAEAEDADAREEAEDEDIEPQQEEADAEENDAEAEDEIEEDD